MGLTRGWRCVVPAATVVLAAVRMVAGVVATGIGDSLVVWIVCAAAVFALAYGAYWTVRPTSYVRSGIKTAATAGLAVAAVGQPFVMVALVFGALGDWLLSRPRGFLAGLISFAVGHVVYLALLWRFAGVPVFWGVAVVAGAGVGLLLWLWPGLGSLRWPVVGYAGVSVALAAVALGVPSGVVTAGVLAFVASDMVLAVVVFGLPERHPAQPYLARLVWALYWGGQAMILFGAKSLISGVDGAGGFG